MSDQEISRKLTTVFYADVVSYSRLTEEDEIATHRAVMASLDLASQTISEMDGTVLRYAGDAILAEFASATRAVDTAVQIQEKLIEKNSGLPDQRKVKLRIGINLGEVIMDRGEIYGTGVNLAARLESVADPAGICISGALYDQVKGKISVNFKDGGMKDFKNISAATLVYHWQQNQDTDTAIPGTEAPGLDSSQPTLAVLPFTNMSGDPEQEYFSDGITEDIITDLSRVSALFVVARNSSFSYKGRAVKIQEVCADLGVRYVLEGSVRKAGNKVRITGQLIDGSTGGHVWANRYDGTLEDIFELQDQVTCQIVDALSIETEQGYADAIGHFQQSVALDPGFARAHYCLYLAAYLKRRVFGEDMALLEIARAAAGHARNLGFRPAVPWVHIERRLDKDKLPGTRNLAREALDKIRDFDPECGSFGYEQMTWVLSAAGFFTATLEFAKHMFDAPGGNYEDSDANEELPNHYAAVGQIDEAIRLWSGEIQKDPLRPGFRLERAILYARTGQFNHAEADIDVLESGKYQYLAKAAYHFHRGEMEKLKEYHNRLVAIKKLHPAIWFTPF